MVAPSNIGPVEVWPLASHLADEMDARGWTCVDVARRMPGDYRRNIAFINLVMAVQDPKILLPKDQAADIAAAFNVSPQYISRLHDAWLRWPNARQSFECPEHLLDGLLFPDNDTE